MEEHVKKPKVLKHGGRVVVLAGEKQVKDMIVFLMFRRLKTLLGNKEQTGGREV